MLVTGKKIGTVGTTGNAVGKPPHLHYAVVTPVPYVWRMGAGQQGWKKMFYLNPDELPQELIPAPLFRITVKPYRIDCPANAF